MVKPGKMKKEKKEKKEKKRKGEDAEMEVDVNEEEEVPKKEKKTKKKRGADDEGAAEGDEKTAAPSKVSRLGRSLNGWSPGAFSPIMVWGVRGSEVCCLCLTLCFSFSAFVLDA